MRIYQWSGDWQKFNAEITDALNLTDNQSEIRIMPSVGTALLDGVYGLRRLAKIKKKVFYLKNSNPMFDAAATALAKEGLEVQGVSFEDLDQPEELIEKMGRDTLLIMYAADDPVLGRRFPVEALQKELSELSVFQVRVSHSAHLYDGLPEPQKSTMHIWGTPSGHALMGLGLRTKISHAGVEYQNWSDIRVEDIQKSLDKVKAKRSPIEEFEALNIAGAKAILNEYERVWDRAVIAWEDVDGFAMMDRIAKLRGIALAEAGQESLLETTSLTRWGGLRGNDWLKAWGLSAESLRGTLIIDANLLDEELPKQVEQAHAEILKEQQNAH